MSAIIAKAPETMTSRERVRRTFEFEKTDRVTIGYEANSAIHAKLWRKAIWRAYIRRWVWTTGEYPRPTSVPISTKRRRTDR